MICRDQWHSLKPYVYQIKGTPWDFLGGPVAKTLHSQCRAPRFNALGRASHKVAKVLEFQPQHQSFK